MVFQKLKNLLAGPESKGHKESSVSINIIGGQSFQNADLTYGIVNITENISAAVVRLCPPGTHKKALMGKPFKIKNEKGAILEISTEAKYDYKETGMWSKWPDPRKLLFSELKGRVDQSENISSEIPCQFILLVSPLLKIAFENELVYNFFRDKFLNKSTKANDEIVLRIAGHNLPFYVSYTYPEEFVRIDEDTHISYTIPEGDLNNYTLRMYPLPPERFKQKIPPSALYKISYPR